MADLHYLLLAGLPSLRFIHTAWANINRGLSPIILAPHRRAARREHDETAFDEFGRCAETGHGRCVSGGHDVDEANALTRQVVGDARKNRRAARNIRIRDGT